MLTDDQNRREHEIAGEKPAMQDQEAIDLVGRPLTVRVLARDTEGARFQRNVIIEFTGAKTNPYWVRWVD